MRKLNRNKVYATIHGHCDKMPNASFVQNGLIFDQNGNECGGTYVQVDDADKAEDANAEVLRLRAELAELKGDKVEPVEEEAPVSLDRMEIIAQLQDLKIQYSGNTGTEKLYAKLQEALNKKADA